MLLAIGHGKEIRHGYEYAAVGKILTDTSRRAVCLLSTGQRDRRMDHTAGKCPPTLYR